MTSTYSNEEIIEKIRSYPFPNSPFKANKVTSETELREVARYISVNLVRFLDKSDSNNVTEEIVRLLHRKTKKTDKKAIVEDYLYRDLIDAKTLKRGFRNQSFSETSNDIFRAFLTLQARNASIMADLQRIAGYYYVFSTNNTEEESFQISMLHIDGQGKGTIKYQNRNYETVEKIIKTELIGARKILIQVKDIDNLIIFYVYIGANPSKPYPYLQAVYLNANRSNKTMANIAVFKKVEEGFEEIYKHFSPQREVSEISIGIDREELVEEDNNLGVKENIQYYLLNLCKPIIPISNKSTVPFNFKSKVARYPSINQRTAKYYKKALEYVGNYFIYFSENYASTLPEVDKTYVKKNPYFNSVSRGILKITKDETSGLLACKFESKKKTNSNITLSYSGHVINHTLNSGDHLILALYNNEEQDKYINLILNAVDESRFIGNFSVIYSSLPKTLGSGTVVVVKQERILRKFPTDERNRIGKFRPTSFFASDFHSPSELEQRIINRLSLRENNVSIPPTYSAIKEYPLTHHYEGLFLMYNYNAKNQHLRVSILRIYRNGLAVHISPKFHGEEFAIAYGNAIYHNNTISLLLHNIIRNRRGFCSIDAGDNVELNDGKNAPDTQTIFYGTFAGVSHRPPNSVTSSKIFLKFITANGEIDDLKNEIRFIQKKDLFSKNSFESIIYHFLVQDKISDTLILKDFNVKEIRDKVSDLKND